VARINRSGAAEEAETIRLHYSPTEPVKVPLPDISDDIINYLNAVFPDALPPVGSAYSEVERAWGRREVIEHLIRAKDQIETDNHVLRRRIISTPSPDAGSTAAASG
jgi:hypothetical protein